MLRTDDAGRWTMDAGRWTMDTGRWTMDAGPSTPYYKLTGELKTLTGDDSLTAGKLSACTDQQHVR